MTDKSAPDEKSGRSDNLAASAAHALALRAAMRYGSFRNAVAFHGGRGADNEELPDVASTMPNANELGREYDAHMDRWLRQAPDGGAAARELYVELAIDILVAELIGDQAVGGSNDAYYAIALLNAVKVALCEDSIREAMVMERARQKPAGAAEARS